MLSATSMTEQTSATPRWLRMASHAASSLTYFALNVTDISSVRSRFAPKKNTSSIITSPHSDVIEWYEVDETSATGVIPERSTLLENYYTFRDPITVRSFLVQHSFLIPFLFEARVKISEYFADTQVALEVVTDPESVSDDQLVAIIVEASSPDEAFDRLERLDNEWWIDAVGRAKGKLCINVEFI